MEKKQSSIDWLVDKLEESGIPLLKDELEFIEQAKALHKEEIEEAHLHAQFKVIEVKRELAEKYYKDFYGGNHE
jgi:hypothetical protein